MINYKETEFGFEFGSAKVNRMCSNEDKKWVIVGIESPKKKIQVYVTKTGKIRIYSEGKEWFQK